MACVEVLLCGKPQPLSVSGRDLPGLVQSCTLSTIRRRQALAKVQLALMKATKSCCS